MLVEPKVYATFIKKDNMIHQLDTTIQWGASKESLGAIVIFKPIKSKFKDYEKHNNFLHLVSGSIYGELEIADDFKRLIFLIKQLNKDHDNSWEQHKISGIFHVYSLYSMQIYRSEGKIPYIRDLCDQHSLEYFKGKNHPWCIIAWEYGKPTKIKNINDLYETKRKWLNATEGFIPTHGVKVKNEFSYFSPIQKSPTEIVDYSRSILKQIKEKEAIISKETIIIFQKSLMISDSTSVYNLFGFKHLKIKSDYKLIGYPDIWAYNNEEEIINDEPSNILSFEDEHCPSNEKPANAMDPMIAIDGDRTPESYLQAAVLSHKLRDLSMERHYGTWRYVTILPFQSEKEAQEKNIEWNMLEPEPEIWDPHFKTSYCGDPMIIFYGITWIYPQITICRYTHLFSKIDYTLKIRTQLIATAKGGIMP